MRRSPVDAWVQRLGRRLGPEPGRAGDGIVHAARRRVLRRRRLTRRSRWPRARWCRLPGPSSSSSGTACVAQHAITFCATTRPTGWSTPPRPACTPKPEAVATADRTRGAASIAARLAATLAVRFRTRPGRHDRGVGGPGAVRGGQSRAPRCCGDLGRDPSCARRHARASVRCGQAPRAPGRRHRRRSWIEHSPMPPCRSRRRR